MRDLSSTAELPDQLGEAQLILDTIIECPQGETTRYKFAPESGRALPFGSFPSPWPFHYGFAPGVSDAAGREWMDVVVCGGTGLPGERKPGRVVGIALRDDGDHKVIAAALDDRTVAEWTTPDDLPASMTDAVDARQRELGVGWRTADAETAWQTMVQTIRANREECNLYTACGSVVFRDDQVMVLVRPSRGEVRLAKGHLEPDEDPVLCAIRETEEESGHGDLKPVGDLGVTRNVFFHEQELWVRDERYFVFALESKRRGKGETQFQTEWLTPAEALARLTFPAERWYVARALAQCQAADGAGDE